MPPEFWTFATVAAAVIGGVVTAAIRAVTAVIRDLIGRRRSSRRR